MTFCSYSGQGTCQDLRRGTEDAGCVDGSHLRAPTDQGEQGHLPPGGLRGKVHVSLPQVWSLTQFYSVALHNQRLV